jgi:hypothetical protein
MVPTYNTSKGDNNIYKNMYLMCNGVNGLEFYTRYKYSKNGTMVDFKNSPWGSYGVIPQAGNITINHGRPTRIVEAVKVVLNGHSGQKLNLGTKLIGDGTSEQVGSITVR